MTGYTAQVTFKGGPLDGWRVAVEARAVRWEIRAARLNGDPVVAADGPVVLDADAARLWTTYYLERYADGAVVFSIDPPDRSERPAAVSRRPGTSRSRPAEG